MRFIDRFFFFEKNKKAIFDRLSNAVLFTLEKFDINTDDLSDYARRLFWVCMILQ
jgi:hypothetical protein